MNPNPERTPIISVQMNLKNENPAPVRMPVKIIGNEAGKLSPSRNPSDNATKNASLKSGKTPIRLDTV
jgi:hypothetical protein